MSSLGVSRVSMLGVTIRQRRRQAVSVSRSEVEGVRRHFPTAFLTVLLQLKENSRAVPAALTNNRPNNA